MSSGHSVTTEPSTAHVQVVVGGVTIADTTRAVLLHETGLPTRYYLPRDDIEMTRLEPSNSISSGPFKGDAIYWSATVADTVVPNIAWSYPTPLPGCADIAGLVCFFDERVDHIA